MRDRALSWDGKRLKENLAPKDAQPLDEWWRGGGAVAKRPHKTPTYRAHTYRKDFLTATATDDAAAGAHTFMIRFVAF